MAYCQYYQAHVEKRYIWIVTGLFRNEDHWCFDRTLEGAPHILEFFVPDAYEPIFLKLLTSLAAEGYVKSYEKLPNRLVGASSILPAS
jgi:hypothetical protein